MSGSTFDLLFTLWYFPEIIFNSGEYTPAPSPTRICTSPYAPLPACYNSTQRLDADVNRAVRNLEIRIRRLLAVVAGGGRDEGERSVTSSAGSLSPLSPAVEGGAGTGKGRRKAVGGIEGSIRQRGPSRAVPPPPPSPPPPPLESETESYSV